jgi:hypothetical protein
MAFCKDCPEKKPARSLKYRLKSGAGTPKALMTITYMYYDDALLRTETPALPAGF